VSLSSDIVAVARLPSATRPWALASLSLAVLLSSLGTSITNVALPTFVEVFDTSFQAVQWIVLAYLLAITTLIVSVGRLGDLLGRRRLMLVGIGVFTAASVACGIAPQLWVLVAARAAQGLGAAVMMALAMAFVGDTIPKSGAGRAMGLLGTMSAVGTALGPTLGGVLLAGFGWRAIFLVSLPLGLVAFRLAYRALPADRPAPDTARPAFDYTGSFVLALTLAAYALAMTLGRGHFGALNAALLCVAFIGVVLFAVVESKSRSPLIRPALFLDRVVGTGFAMSALVTTVAMTTLVVGPFHLSGALHLDPVVIGLVMSAGPLVAALVGVPAGRGVDRFGARPMTVAGLGAMATGCVLLSRMPLTYGAWGYVAPLVLVTAGFAVFQAANNTAVMTAVDAAQRGVVSGLLNLSRNLGLVTGASLMGAVFALAAGTGNVATAGADAVATGTHVTFGVAALLVAIALVLAVTTARKPSA
jgi:EmrB/QacA subfamily drug resistance transporter